MAFISWLMSLGFQLNQIAPQMVSLGDSGTLAQLYANLTSDSASNAWSKFQSAIQALPSGVTSDDPFGAFTAAAAVPASIPAQLTPGTAATQKQARAPKSSALKAATCPPKSHRLFPPKRNAR